MPNPFPGMNPYLESPKYWRGLHQSLAYCCYSILNATLAPGFLAQINEQISILEPPRQVVPNVIVVRQDKGNTAVLDRPVPLIDEGLYLSGYASEVRESFVEIFEESDLERVITTIEILSPTHKESRLGRREYLKKQNELFWSDTHLLEIDLLWSGKHTVAVPESFLYSQRDFWDYIMCLHRANTLHVYQVWPLSVRDRLPRVPIPLTTGHPEAALDMQAVFNRAYNEGTFDRKSGLYRNEPPPPLSPGNALLADTLLRE